MDKKVVVMYSGWCERDAADVVLIDVETGEQKTASEWIKERGNIDGLILESFDDFHSNALDGEFTELSLSIEDSLTTGYYLVFNPLTTRRTVMYPDPDTLERIRMTVEKAEANRQWFLGQHSRPANKLVYPPAPEHYEDENDYQDEADQIEEFSCH